MTAALAFGRVLEVDFSAENEAPSYLDTKGITRRAEGVARPSKARTDQFIDRVCEFTAAHRTRKAARLSARAREVRRVAQSEAISGSGLWADVESAGKWHLARAKGQINRREIVRECGADAVSVSCGCCGVVDERAARCGVGLLCVSCRGKGAAKKRALLGSARESAVSAARSRGLYRSSRRGGRWGERFLTLTAPHRPDCDVKLRIDRVRDAWPFFVRSLNAWVRRLSADERRVFSWFRAFEWTPGSDGLGHPHFHVWALSPFLPQDLLSDWWRAALEKSGYSKRDVERSFVHIKPATSGVELEVIKYMTKDLIAPGEHVDAGVFAAVYRALDGARLTQSSRGFMSRASRGPRPCASCGVLGARVVRRLLALPPGVARLERRREDRQYAVDSSRGPP